MKTETVKHAGWLFGWSNVWLVSFLACIILLDYSMLNSDIFCKHKLN